MSILIEDFDGVWSGDPAAPEGWTVVNSDGDTSTWSQANTYISTQLNGYGAHGMGSQDDWLISPVISLNGGYGLYWWDVVESAFYNNTYDVYVFPNGDITAGVNLGTYDCVNTVLTESFINLAEYDGQDVSIGFHQTYSGSSGDGRDDGSNHLFAPK